MAHRLEDRITETLEHRRISHHPGHGDDNSFGSALKTGIVTAQGKFIIFMDSDGSHSPEFINNLYNNKCDNCVVIASRYIKGGFTDNNILLVWMSKILNIVYSRVLSLKIKDVSNNFKLYDAKLLKCLELKCDNFDIVEEILFKIVKHNINVTIIEIPYTFKKRMFSKTKRNIILFMFTFLVTLIKLVQSNTSKISN
ncbi:MAG: glycosyltransferase, partial [Deltaproteobacteria bacterium]|nr:glycosyltransferase [Deltaproteobacteria bacterium]